MKPKKLNFSEMKNALSRDELKKIMAGSGDYCVNTYCYYDWQCTIKCDDCWGCSPGNGLFGICTRKCYKV